MERAYFCDIRSKITENLNSASDSIQIAMAWFTSQEIFKTLLRCLRRNVKVELILLDSPINRMYYAPNFNDFIKSGGKLRIAKQDIGFLHHKFCIIDNRTVITGSYNWTYFAENRNIENILVSYDRKIIDLFAAEFSRLKEHICLSDSFSQYSWEDVEAMDNVNVHELNYEIERICEVQGIPTKRVFSVKTEVIERIITRKPISKYAIGVEALDDNDNPAFKLCIDSGTKLPCCSEDELLYFDGRLYKELRCKFIFGNPNDSNDWHLLKEVDLTHILRGVVDQELPIKFSMNLDDNGSLRVDVSCQKTGNAITISTLNSDLIDYK